MANGKDGLHDDNVGGSLCAKSCSTNFGFGGTGLEANGPSVDGTGPAGEDLGLAGWWETGVLRYAGGW